MGVVHFEVAFLFATFLLPPSTKGAASAGGSNSTGNVTSSAPAWSFNLTDSKGPRFWKSIGYPYCNGTQQSPIRINTTNVMNSAWPGFEFMHYEPPSTGSTWGLGNNGHGVVVFVYAQPNQPRIKNGNLPEDYILDSFHWHIGSTNDQGSEHIIDDSPYAMEMHLVHFKSSMGSLLPSAVSAPMGLAVLGVNFMVEGNDNAHFEPILKYFSNVTYKGDYAHIPPLNLRKLLPSNTGEFYRYAGGLTTPPCYESVIWTVFKEPVKISQNQMNTFRSLYFTKKGYTVPVSMLDNRRPTQELHSRTVYFNTAPPQPSTTGSTTGSTTPDTGDAEIVVYQTWIVFSFAILAQLFTLY